MRKTPLIRKTPLRASPLSKDLQGKNLGETKALKLPWVRCIPFNSKSHGLGTLEKKLWTLVSHYTRIRDAELFQSKCVATGRYLDWKSGAAGHFISYVKCNGMFKFFVTNIHLQSMQSNSYGRREDWNYYEAELERRYGPGVIQALEVKNRDSYPKYSSQDVLDYMKFVIGLMGELKEQPQYYQRVISLLNK